jgi:molecular chaperone DnaK
MLDVIPLSLNIEIEEDIATQIIERNTPIPISKTFILSTAHDNQRYIDIYILIGESSLVVNNRILGHFIIKGIPPAHKDTLRIEVTLSVDVNGILNLTAVNKTTNKKYKIACVSFGGLSKNEIEKLVQETEQPNSEDTGDYIIV